MKYFISLLFVLVGLTAMTQNSVDTHSDDTENKFNTEYEEPVLFRSEILNSSDNYSQKDIKEAQHQILREPINCWDTLFTKEGQMIPCKITSVKSRTISYKLCRDSENEIKIRRRKVNEFSRNGSHVMINGKSRLDTSTFGGRILIGLGTALGLVGLFYLFLAIFVV